MPANTVIIYSPRRLTPTERSILAYVLDHEGEACSKEELAAILGRSKVTVSKSISRLRADGLLLSEPCYDENGAQLANAYRLAPSGASAVSRVSTR